MRFSGPLVNVSNEIVSVNGVTLLPGDSITITTTFTFTSDPPPALPWVRQAAEVAEWLTRYLHDVGRATYGETRRAYELTDLNDDCDWFRVVAQAKKLGFTEAGQPAVFFLPSDHPLAKGLNQWNS